MPTSSPRPRELVLFLHAVGGVPDQWAPQRAALAGRYATRAVNLSLPVEAVSMAAMARLVLAAMDEEGYARAHLVGLSMGGVVALETFAQAPERVRSLTLTNTWAHMADGGPGPHRRGERQEPPGVSALLGGDVWGGLPPPARQG